MSWLGEAESVFRATILLRGIARKPIWSPEINSDRLAPRLLGIGNAEWTSKSCRQGEDQLCPGRNILEGAAASLPLEWTMEQVRDEPKSISERN